MADPATHPPTTPCPVRFHLSDGSTVAGVVWLLPDPTSPGGVTSLESVLDGPRDFIAVGLDGRGTVLVSRCGVRTVEIASGTPGAPELPVGASLDVLTIHMDSGEEVSGVLRALTPEGSPRMSDVFNGSSRFVVLGLGDRLVLVNRERIVRVSF